MAGMGGAGDGPYGDVLAYFLARPNPPGHGRGARSVGA